MAAMSCSIAKRCLLIFAVGVSSTPFCTAAVLSAEKAAEMLNKQYMGLVYTIGANQTVHVDNKSLLGVTVSFAADPTSFNNNLFCHPLMGTHCYDGFADCRLSASIYNSHMVNNNFIWTTVFGRAVGYVFNQTMVEQSLAKCSYIFDGASENRLNNGCGLGGGANCSLNTSAYADICPSTDKICTANDTEVKGSLCAPFGPAAVPNRSGAGYQCFWSGPALNYPKQDQPNHLREMVEARFTNELRTLEYKEDNEIVIDERALIHALRTEPANVIPAFVYSKAQEDQQAKENALAMRDKFCKDYKVAGKIPVLGINDVSDFRPSGPFFVPDEERSMPVVV